MPVFKTDANLVSLWLLNEVSGIRYDSVGPNDLTDNNTVESSTDCQEGVRSADFERGNAEYLSIADAAQAGLDITGDITILAWIKPESNVIGTIVGKYATAPQHGYLFYVNTGPVIQCILSPDGTNDTTAIGGTTLDLGEWYHVAVVYNGTDIRIYVNGVLDANGAENPYAYTGGIYDSSTQFELGHRVASSNYYDGLMDEVAVFNRALSADEVADIFNFGILDPKRSLVLRPRVVLSSVQHLRL